MKYLIMECHPGYAIALSEEGSFLKVANLNYEVGQEVEQVIASGAVRRKRSSPVLRLLPAVACLCLVVLGAWHFLFSVYGTVRMQINPDVMISVNRLDYVVGLEGLNGDGEALIDGVDTFGKTVDQISDELAEKARDMGFLADEGDISLTVNSDSGDWIVATEERLVLKLEVNQNCHVSVIHLGDDHHEHSHESQQVTNPMDDYQWDDDDDCDDDDHDNDEHHNDDDDDSDD